MAHGYDGWVYNEHKSFYMPDVQVDPRPNLKYEALRGYAYVLAALDESGVCVGWLLSDRLGYATAKDWLAAQPKQGTAFDDYDGIELAYSYWTAYDNYRLFWWYRG